MTGKGGPGPSLSFVWPLASGTVRAQNGGNMASRSVAQSSASTLSSAILVPEDDAGWVSTSTSRSAARWCSAKRRTLSWGEADVVEVAGRQLRHRRLDIALGQPELGR